MNSEPDTPRDAAKQQGRSDGGGLPPEVCERLEKRWQRAYSIQGDDDLRAFYADWAGTYDADHDVIGCFHHTVNTELLARHLPDKTVRILDVGAGTGLAGAELKRLGYYDLAAVDFSEEMLDVARQREIYRRYWVLNLNHPLPEIEAHSFDAAIAVGVFSYGQVEKGCLDEMLRIVRPGGLVTFTQRTDFHESNAMGFRDRQRQLEEAGRWSLVEITDPAAYLPEKEPDATFSAWIYRVSGRAEGPR